MLDNSSFVQDEDTDMANTGQLSAMLEVANDSPEWQETIQKVVPTVVSIRFCQPCSFDTEYADTSEATGFVVDAERGCVFFWT
jgi:pro-apoptotic serine protease NMA111